MCSRGLRIVGLARIPGPPIPGAPISRVFRMVRCILLTGQLVGKLEFQDLRAQPHRQKQFVKIKMQSEFPHSLEGEFKNICAQWTRASDAFREESSRRLDVLRVDHQVCYVLSF
jgi:hypothetical protein